MRKPKKAKKVYSRRPEKRFFLMRCPECGTQRNTDASLKKPTCGDCWLLQGLTVQLVHCNRELRPAPQNPETVPADLPVFSRQPRGY